MADFISRLIKRNLGQAEVVLPVFPFCSEPTAELQPRGRLEFVPDEAYKTGEEPSALAGKEARDMVPGIALLPSRAGRRETRSPLCIKPDIRKPIYLEDEKGNINRIGQRAIFSAHKEGKEAEEKTSETPALGKSPHIPRLEPLTSPEIRGEMSSPQSFEAGLETVISPYITKGAFSRADKEAFITARKEEHSETFEVCLSGKESPITRDEPLPEKQLEEPLAESGLSGESVQTNQSGDVQSSRSLMVQAHLVRPIMLERQADHKLSGKSRRNNEVRGLAEPPTIKVHIGRVEVRAIMEQMPKPRKAFPSGPRLSLDDYLKQHKGGR